VKRSFSNFVGVDLGGGRGKTTALAVLQRTGDSVEVVEVATRAGTHAWTDDTLANRLLEAPGAETVIAVQAPLTQHACGRCERPICPGMEACADPAVVWLRTEGRGLVRGVGVETANSGSRSRATEITPAWSAQARLVPYAHRATDVVMTYGRGLLPISALGAVNGAIAARGRHLRKRLAGAGYQLHANLLEVSPAATVAALCGRRAARGYKRDADPWRTRAVILEQLALAFGARSRMAREDVLQNDHCFDAVIAAYTAYLWARDGWDVPEDWLAEDGWIVAPP
jgi:hypothetical protein